MRITLFLMVVCVGLAGCEDSPPDEWLTEAGVPLSCEQAFYEWGTTLTQAVEEGAGMCAEDTDCMLYEFTLDCAEESSTSDAVFGVCPTAVAVDEVEAFEARLRPRRSGLCQRVDPECAGAAATCIEVEAVCEEGACTARRVE